MVPTISVWIGVAVLVCLAPSAEAQVDVSGALYGLYEGATGTANTQADEEPGEDVPRLRSYGDILAEVRLRDPDGAWSFVAEGHTDTWGARASIGAGRRGVWSLEPTFRMQIDHAGLLHERYHEGTYHAGYRAGYVATGLGVRFAPAPHHTVRVSAGYRRWSFDPLDDVMVYVTPPYEEAVELFESRVSYTWYDVQPDDSLITAAHPTRRVVGLMVTVEAGLDARADAAQQSTFDRDDGAGFIHVSGSLSAISPRTVRPTTVETLRQELHWGHRVSGRTRVQLGQWAGWGHDEDELTWTRFGGTWSQYFVPVAGRPWGVVMASRYLALEPAWVVSVGSNHELAVVADIALVDRLFTDRTNNVAGVVTGVSARADLRWDTVQFDLRAGFSPTPGEWTRSHNTLHLTVGAGLGFDLP